MMDTHRHLPDNVAGDLVTSAGKAAPPLAVSGSLVAGMTLQDWVLISALVYTVLQLAWLLYKIVRHFRDGADG